jgi:translation elongation factor EF-Tu-like GTPase
MVNIGLLGDISVGKTSILRLFVRYLNRGDIEKVEGGIKATVVKTDFSGEATVPRGNKTDTLDEKETKTIHPNRVVFREDASGKAHTIFAPGGDRARAVVKMGIITISRIATQIIAVFSLDRDLDRQFEFFNDVRFFPEKIYVCINKVDLLKGDKEKEIEKLTKKINDFFTKRKIIVQDIFVTCGETVENFEEVEKYNNRVAEMILIITTSH